MKKSILTVALLFLLTIIAAACSDRQELTEGMGTEPDDSSILDLPDSSDTGQDTESSTDSDTVNNSLSQTYTNELEGFTFNYPNGWRIVSDEELYSNFDEDWEWYSQDWLKNIVVFLAGENEESGYPAMNIEVNRFRANRYEIEMVFTASPSVFEEIISRNYNLRGFSSVNTTVLGLEDIYLDGVAARQLIFIQNNIHHLRVYYAINDIMYLITFKCMSSDFEEAEPVFRDILDSFIITRSADTTGLDGDNDPATGELYGDVYIHGFPVSQILNKPFVEILGPPVDYRGPYIFYDGFELHATRDDATETFEAGIAYRITAFGSDLEQVHFNGISFDKSFEELRAALGNPVEFHRYPSGYIYSSSEHGVNTVCYHLRNDVIDYILIFLFEWSDVLPDGLIRPDVKPYGIDIIIYSDRDGPENDTISGIFMGRPIYTTNGSTLLSSLRFSCLSLCHDQIVV